MSEQVHFDNFRYISDNEMRTECTDGYQPGGTNPIQILDQRGSSFNVLNGTSVSFGRFEPDPIFSDILSNDPLLDISAFVPVNLEPESMAAHRSLQQKTMANINVPHQESPIPSSSNPSNGVSHFPQHSSNILINGESVNQPTFQSYEQDEMQHLSNMPEDPRVSNDVNQQYHTPSSYPENIYVVNMDANTQRDYGSDPTTHVEEEESMPESDQPFFSQNGYNASGSHTSQQNYQNAQWTPEFENDDELCLGKEMFIWLLDCLRWLNIEAIRNPCKDYFRPSLIPLGNAFNIINAANYEFLKQLPRTSHQTHHNFYCRFQHDTTVEEGGSTPPNNNEDEIIID
ncbi:unnamed protein product [Orchesella dallaii]|uniref:Uncharacterized protein n=1 Tax=Orchesella dallaii TaxID=48710 RepID=A0ABP1QYW5_9HEXA